MTNTILLYLEYIVGMCDVGGQLVHTTWRRSIYQHGMPLVLVFNTASVSFLNYTVIVDQLVNQLNQVLSLFLS